jgi:hypothetical protein
MIMGAEDVVLTPEVQSGKAPANKISHNCTSKFQKTPRMIRFDNRQNAPFILDYNGPYVKLAAATNAATNSTEYNKIYKLHRVFVPAANSRVFLCRLQTASQRASESVCRGVGGEGWGGGGSRPLNLLAP